LLSWLLVPLLSIHVFLGRPLFLLSSGIHSIINFDILWLKKMKNLQYFRDKINPNLDLKFPCSTSRYTVLLIGTFPPVHIVFPYNSLFRMTVRNQRKILQSTDW
jgi:hypothetical protein